MSLLNVCYLLFAILHSFGTRESIRQKVNHGGHIVFKNWLQATNLARATVFVVYTSPTRVVVWVRGKAEQKCSLIFCVFRQTRSKCFFILYVPQIVASTKPFCICHALPCAQHYLKLRVATLKLSQSSLQLNTIDVTQIAFALVRHTLEAQISCLHVGLNFEVGKELLNESQS